MTELRFPTVIRKVKFTDFVKFAMSTYVQQFTQDFFSCEFLGPLIDLTDKIWELFG